MKHFENIPLLVINIGSDILGDAEKAGKKCVALLGIHIIKHYRSQFILYLSRMLKVVIFLSMDKEFMFQLLL